MVVELSETEQPNAAWFPCESRGTALGIFGAGNVGAAATIFFGANGVGPTVGGCRLAGGAGGVRGRASVDTRLWSWRSTRPRFLTLPGRGTCHRATIRVGNVFRPNRRLAS